MKIGYVLQHWKMLNNNLMFGMQLICAFSRRFSSVFVNPSAEGALCHSQCPLKPLEPLRLHMTHHRAIHSHIFGVTGWKAFYAINRCWSFLHRFATILYIGINAWKCQFKQCHAGTLGMYVDDTSKCMQCHAECRVEQGVDRGRKLFREVR